MSQTAPLADRLCPSCGSVAARLFYTVERAPAHSVLLLASRAEAVSYPTGEIALAFCAGCGFVYNTRFKPELHEYSARYEATQGFSRTFSAFARQQAQSLIDRYDIRGRRIIEIGCGQGEFLALMCELGDNSGIGFDPAYRAEPLDSPAADRLTFIADFYDERHSDQRADLVICRMTLEHIDQTRRFIETVRHAVGDDDATRVFFQVPNAHYVFNDLAFWDVYYEHCSYFSAGSLARLFRLCRFDVLAVEAVYDNQYLTLIAKPAPAPTAPALDAEDDLARMAAAVARFEASVPDEIAKWRYLIDMLTAQGQKVVVWGGGSKGVTFLNTVGIDDRTIAQVVDINPKKHGMYMAGTGQVIVGADALRESAPDVVIVMNPIYIDEIRQDLAALGLSPELLPV